MRHIIGDERTEAREFCKFMELCANTCAHDSDTHLASMVVALSAAIRQRMLLSGGSFQDALDVLRDAPIAPREPEPVQNEITPAFTHAAREREERRKPWWRPW